MVISIWLYYTYFYRVNLELFLKFFINIPRYRNAILFPVLGLIQLIVEIMESALILF